MIFKDAEETLISMMDGFEIEEIIDDEEPLFVSREDPVIMPDYSGKKPLVLIMDIFCSLPWFR